MHTYDYIVAETKRQSGTMREAVGMHAALVDARISYDCGDVISEEMILSWANSINEVTGYRAVPATFTQGVPALGVSLIPRAMERLVEGLSLVTKPSADDANLYTREFLAIHPFADGNGRVGSIMCNYLNGTIHSPVQMPYYFGPYGG